MAVFVGQAIGFYILYRTGPASRRKRNFATADYGGARRLHRNLGNTVWSCLPGGSRIENCTHESHLTRWHAGGFRAFDLNDIGNNPYACEDEQTTGHACRETRPFWRTGWFRSFDHVVHAEHNSLIELRKNELKILLFL
jgi:hypothetical protein